uniref:Glucuronosyltransferase n=1 Tax=Rhabditophanes sp. KR3021 TaxID=114890 RepID=A0AC35TXT6_9BILA
MRIVRVCIYKHNNVYDSLSDILVKAGNDVTYLVLPMDHELTTIGTKLSKVITLEYSPETLEYSEQMGELKSSLWVKDFSNPTKILALSRLFKNFARSTLKHVLANETLIELIKAEKFDLGVTESFDMSAFGLFKVFDIPAHVSMFAGGLFSSHYKYFGMTYPVSQVPTLHASFADTEMTFVSRFKNFISFWAIDMFTSFNLDNLQDIFNQKYGNGFVDIPDQVRKSSFHISNADPYLDFTTPAIAKIVQLGGFSIPKPNLLDKKWSDILNKRKRNVLVSFGTNCKSTDMPLPIRNAFLETFAKFPDVTFIWKYESAKDGTAKDLPNVFLSEWLPQTDILADSRLSGFVTHGGLNSISEAAHTGTKVLVIPLFADQYRNSKIAEKIGFGTILKKEDIVPHKLSAALRKLLEDESELTRNAQRIGEMIKNRPYNTTELFIKHIEFASKFKQLPHLNMESHDTYFFQYLMLDVIGAILLALILILSLITLCICTMYKKCCRKTNIVSDPKKHD